MSLLSLPDSPKVEEQVLKNSFLYMYEGKPIADFLKECEIVIVKHDNKGLNRLLPFIFTFKVPAPTFKKYELEHGYFQAKLKEDLHRYHQYDSVVVHLTGDWEKLELVYTEVRPVLTPWDEINRMQEHMLSQIHTADQTIAFQNVGNTARHLMRKMADIIFVEAKHTPAGNTKDLSPDKFKNRLWAFVLYKIRSSSSGDAFLDYAESLLLATDKAIDLSNGVTHALKADAFLAQSCAVSTIAAVQVIRLVYGLPDPADGAAK